jgi:hypothetical protein
MNGYSRAPSDRTADLENFVETHRAHGRLAVACACGVTFHRWVTPREAAEDLVVLARRN